MQSIARRSEAGRALGSHAKLLEYDAQRGLVADVHRTIVELAQRTNDVSRTLDSMLMRGYGLRMQGRLGEASEASAALRTAAAAAGDERYRLESQLSDAKSPSTAATSRWRATSSSAPSMKRRESSAGRPVGIAVSAA